MTTVANFKTLSIVIVSTLISFSFQLQAGIYSDKNFSNIQITGTPEVEDVEWGTWVVKGRDFDPNNCTIEHFEKSSCSIKCTLSLDVVVTCDYKDAPENKAPLLKKDAGTYIFKYFKINTWADEDWAIFTNNYKGVTLQEAVTNGTDKFLSELTEPTYTGQGAGSNPSTSNGYFTIDFPLLAKKVRRRQLLVV